MFNLVPVKKFSDRLYYNEFKYSLSINLIEASVFRGMTCYDAEDIDQKIHVRRVWQSTYGTHGKRMHAFTAKVVRDLHTVGEKLLVDKKSRLVCWRNGFTLYTSDLEHIKSIVELDCARNPSLTSMTVNRPANSIELKNSKFSHRTYLKTYQIDLEEKQKIINLLKNHSANIRLSPSLQKYIDTKSKLTKMYWYDNFFIDHNGKDILLLLSLVRPGVVRKTFDIISNK